MTTTNNTQTHYRACHLCEAICGLEIVTQGEQILSIKGDKNDPFSQGHVCPKAVALQDIHTDPDRLRQPMKRLRDQGNGDEWVPISWEEALDTTAEKLLEIRAKYGADAMAVYMGNPTAHNYGMVTHAPALFRQLRTKNRYSATSVDQLPHSLTSLWLFGHQGLFPIADIDNTDFFLALGANPLASNGSIMTAPGVKHRLKAIQARGGKVVTVDPRRTETAAIADQHHFIKPGTDALLLLAMLNTLFREGLTRLEAYGDWVEGLDAVAEAVKRFTPELAAPITGVPAEAIVTLTREFAGADKAICYARMGLSVQSYGALCQWLVQLINIATGNLDREGGVMFTTPALDSIPTGNPGSFDTYRSRVRNLPEFNRELPVATLAEEITTPGDGQIRALFTGAGNPVLSTPNGEQLDEALASLEFMVSLDPYLNETTRHADIILPPTSPLEHDHYDLFFFPVAVRNTVRFNEPVFDKPEGSLHDWEIFCELGERVARALGNPQPPRMEPKTMMAMGIEQGPYSARAKHEMALTMDKVLEAASGIDLGPLQPQLPERLQTKDKRIHCDQPLPMADIERAWQELVMAKELGREVVNETTAGDGFLLIGRRHVRCCNSWMHNYKRLVKGKERCTLMMSPDDLARLGVADGEQVRVSSRVGSQRVAVEASDDMMPGVVSLPHGWGHNRDGSRLGIASEHAGVSVNDLTDDLLLDGLSGNAALNGVPVTVESIAAG